MLNVFILTINVIFQMYLKIRNVQGVFVTTINYKYMFWLKLKKLRLVLKNYMYT